MGVDQAKEEELKQRLEALRSSRPQGPVPQSTPEFDSDLIPEVSFDKKPEEIKLDGFLEQVDILQAYITFCGKMTPDDKDGRRNEGVKISCPMPGHADTHPSAWINTDKQVWYCGACMVGGDSYDLAALSLGHDLSSYKINGAFPKLRREMAARLGFSIIKSITGEETFYAPSFEPVESKIETTTDAQIVQIDDLKEIDDLAIVDFVAVDWESILTADTFLRRYMECSTIDDLPHEFHFFQGLMALGFAGATNVYLTDFKPVKANLYVCLYGRTGVGKSRSIDPFIRLLESVLPYDGVDHTTSPEGVLITPVPGSAEALLDTFEFKIVDDEDKVIGLAQIKGLLKVEELSSFIARASRTGSSMKETLIEMYDVFGGDMTLSTRKLGTSRIRNPFVQMLTTTQPKAIHAFLRSTDRESGFLNRWIYAAGRSRRAPLSYGSRQIDINDASNALRNIVAWSNTPRAYKLEDDALAVWDEFFHRELAQYKTGEQEMESMFSRIDLILKKLIILFAIDKKESQPSAFSVQQAISLYTYLKRSYNIFSGDLTFDELSECENRILAVIRKLQDNTGTPPSANQIRQHIGSRFTKEMTIKALANLKILDLVDEQMTPPAGRGRPTKRYSVAFA